MSAVSYLFIMITSWNWSTIQQQDLQQTQLDNHEKEFSKVYSFIKKVEDDVTVNIKTQINTLAEHTENEFNNIKVLLDTSNGYISDLYAKNNEVCRSLVEHAELIGTF